MELVSQSQPPSVPSTTTNHKMTTRCLFRCDSSLSWLSTIRWSCTRGTLCMWWRSVTTAGSLAPAREQVKLLGWRKPSSFFFCFRNLRNFPRQLCDTDIAMAGRGNLTLATVQSAAPHILTKDFPSNHRLVRLTSQLSPTTNTATAPLFGSPDFVKRLAWLLLWGEDSLCFFFFQRLVRRCSSENAHCRKHEWSRT